MTAKEKVIEDLILWLPEENIRNSAASEIEFINNLDAPPELKMQRISQLESRLEAELKFRSRIKVFIPFLDALPDGDERFAQIVDRTPDGRIAIPTVSDDQIEYKFETGNIIFRLDEKSSA